MCRPAWSLTRANSGPSLSISVWMLTVVIFSIPSWGMESRESGRVQKLLNCFVAGALTVNGRLENDVRNAVLVRQVARGEVPPRVQERPNDHARLIEFRRLPHVLN